MNDINLDFSKVIQKQKDRIADLIFDEILKQTQIEQLIELVSSQDKEIEELKSKIEELSPNKEK